MTQKPPHDSDPSADLRNARRHFLTAAPLGIAVAGAALSLGETDAAGATGPAATAAVPRLLDTSQKFGRYRVNATLQRPAPEVIAGFRRVSREVVTEHVGRSQIMNPALKFIPLEENSSRSGLGR